MTFTIIAEIVVDMSHSVRTNNKTYKVFVEIIISIVFGPVAQAVRAPR